MALTIVARCMESCAILPISADEKIRECGARTDGKRYVLCGRADIRWWSVSSKTVA